MKNTGAYPRVHVDTGRVAAVGQAGGVLLTETVRATGLDKALSDALSPWRKPFAVHEPGKVVLHLAIALALGGDTPADTAAVRGEPGVFGRVASDPTVSRTIAALAADSNAAIAAINTARQAARSQAWALAGKHAPDFQGSAKRPLIIDLDATLITAHSEQESAKPTFKKGFGFHPLCAFADHGAAGTGERLAIKLRPDNAGSNTATDHIDVVKLALAQLPDASPRPGKNVLIRAEGRGGTHEFIAWLTGRRLSYSIGFTLPFETPELYKLIPEEIWTPAYDANGSTRDGANVAELTGLMNLGNWPAGMRVIVRRERPHPGAQLRFEDRIRIARSSPNARSTAPRNLPLQGFEQNRIWCLLVTLATDPTAWMGLLAHPDEQAQRWEPKRLRYRLFSIPAGIARTGRRRILHPSDRAA